MRLSSKMNNMTNIIINDNFDIRLKKILFNPFEMFNFLKKKKDYILWIKFLNFKLNTLYNNNISISSNDYKIIGEIIFLLLSIKTQNLKDNSYINFLSYCNKNKKFILYNNRINLKIKDCFPFITTQINLGYMAKHLTWNKSPDISLESKKINPKIEQLKMDLKIMTKKYYKYKGKYLKIKENNNNISSISSSIKHFIL